MSVTVQPYLKKNKTGAAMSPGHVGRCGRNVCTYEEEELRVANSDPTRSARRVTYKKECSTLREEQL
jgi:hypothetical protein